MAKVIFIDQTRKAPKKFYTVVGWYIVGVLAILALGVFIYHPDWLLVPPNL